MEERLKACSYCSSDKAINYCLIGENVKEETSSGLGHPKDFTCKI